MPRALLALLALCCATALYVGKHVLIDARHIRPPLAAPAYAVDPPERRAPAAAEAEDVDLATLLTEVTIAQGEQMFRRCVACHRLDEGASAAGPHLIGVVGRPIAAVESYAYSDALTEKGGVWDFEALSDFIAAPRDWAPGTSKTFAGVEDAAQRAAILFYLNAVAPAPQPFPQPGGAVATR